MNAVLLTTFWEVMAWIVFAFFWVLVIWMFVFIFADIFRRPDLSGVGKAVWIFVIFILPLIGILIYLIARPRAVQGGDDIGVLVSQAAAQSSPEQIGGPKQLM